MRIIDWVVAFNIAVLPALAFAQQTYGAKQPVVVHSEDFKGFEKCQPDEKLGSIIEGMFETPVVKKENVWVYGIKGEYFGLRVREIWVGVCDENGERACGWASFLALVISSPVQEVKALLLKKTGIDFTLEERDNETRRTLRPILESSRDNKSESIMYCDPGNL